MLRFFVDQCRAVMSPGAHRMVDDRGGWKTDLLSESAVSRLDPFAFLMEEKLDGEIRIRIDGK